MTAKPPARTVEKLNVKIGGMQCSFCVENIHKAYARMEGARAPRKVQSFREEGRGRR